MSRQGAARGGRLFRASPWSRAVTGALLTLVGLVGFLALMADAAAWRTVQGIGPRLAGAVTVVVWARGLESADAAAARAGEILTIQPGVAAVTPLDPAPGDALIARIVGAPTTSEVRLLSIDSPDDAAGLADRIEVRLAAQGIHARAADHSWQDSAGARAAGAIAIAGVLAPLLAVLGFVALGAVEAGRELRRGRATVELMTISGASDGFIAGEARRRASGLALTAVAWAAALAMLAAPLISRSGLASVLGGLTRADMLTPWPALIILLWPAAALGAWLGARGRLRRGV